MLGSYHEQWQDLLKQDNFIGNYANWYMIAAAWLTMPIYVLLRRNFGERYFSFPIMVMYLVIFWAFLIPFLGRDEKGIWQILTIFLAALSLYHSFAIWNRNRRNIRWHSRYDGDSILDLLPGSRSVVRSIYEPMLIFSVGICMMYYYDAPVIGFWFLISVGFMGFLEKLKQSAARDAYLNAVDSQIESEHINDVVAGETAKKSEGYVVHGISDVSAKKRQKLLETLKKGFDAKEKAEAAQKAQPQHIVQTPKPAPRPAAKSQNESV